MLNLTFATRIYVYTTAMDMRKGVDGLSGIVRGGMRRGSNRRQLVRVYQSPSGPHEDPALRRWWVLVALSSARGRHLRRVAATGRVALSDHRWHPVSDVAFRCLAGEFPSTPQTLFTAGCGTGRLSFSSAPLPWKPTFSRHGTQECWLFFRALNVGLRDRQKLLGYQHERSPVTFESRTRPVTG